jgi:uncharacterized lipoprotein
MNRISLAAAALTVLALAACDGPLSTQPQTADAPALREETPPTPTDPRTPPDTTGRGMIGSGS